MTSAWMGLSSLHAQIDQGRISLIGDAALSATIENWMTRSSFAPVGCGSDKGRRDPENVPGTIQFLP